jgi:dihydropteroate synthase-like protein
VDTPAAPEKVLFVTGRLAERALRGVLEAMRPAFAYDVAVMPISVAALMTTAWIAARLAPPAGCDLVVIPGLCEGDLAVLQDRAGVPVVRGPKDLLDLPDYFGRPTERAGYGTYTIRIFAEIHNAPDLSLDALLARAEYYRQEGADVIDLGCAVGRRWPQIGEAVATLKARGFTVSVDTFDPGEILDADAAGVDYVLSLNASNLDLAPRLRAVPVVVPDFDGGMASLEANVAAVEALGRPFIVDPIIAPLNFGFADSVQRLWELRRRRPHVQIMIGTHHVTELLDADSVGVNALLTALAQELGVNYILTTEVAPWARGTVRELDIARRLAAYSQARGVFPKNLEDRLLVVKDRRVARYALDELRALQRQVRDPNYRIFVTDDRICVFNAERFVTGVDIQEIFAQLDVDEATHAFYLGRELMKAHLALVLGKAYMQEQSLDWGYLTPPAPPPRHVKLTQRKRRGRA